MPSEGSFSGRLRGSLPATGSRARAPVARFATLPRALCQLHATWHSGQSAASPLFPGTCSCSCSTVPRCHRLLFAHRDPIGNVALSPRAGVGMERWGVVSVRVAVQPAHTPARPPARLDWTRAGKVRVLVTIPAGWYDLTQGRRSGGQIPSHRLVQSQTRSQEKVLPAEMLRPRRAFLCMRGNARTTSWPGPEAETLAREGVKPCQRQG
jgi:hypothetical protein